MNERPNAPSRWSRRRVLGGFAAAGLAEVFGLEPRWLDVAVHPVAVPGLPRALEGARLAQLTDVHLNAPEDWVIQRVLAALRAHEVQWIVVTGDVIDREASLPAMEQLCDALRKHTPRVFATAGNWEHWGNVPTASLARGWARAGGTFLSNQSCASEGLVLAGTDDNASGHADLPRTLEALPAGALRVLLSHAPGILDEAHAVGTPRFELCLSGHTHGGQVRLGTLAPVVPPGSGRFVAGFYETRLGRAYVSRGIGTSLVPVRAMCRPELPIFEFVRA